MTGSRRNRQLAVLVAWSLAAVALGCGSVPDAADAAPHEPGRPSIGSSSPEVADSHRPELPAQPPPAPAATPVVEWRPESPIQGAVVALSVRPGDSVPASAIVGVDGSVSDQALLFERRDDGSWIAVGGIPIDTRDSLSIPLLVHLAGAVSESLQVSLPVAEGEYRLERLTVAPRFGRPPDSALARRMADESTRARAVSRQALSTPRLWSAPFHRPRPGRITSGFGHGRMFNGEVQSRHMGTDFAGAVGTPVRVANCGIVRLVADFYLAGRAIYVDHGAGLVTGYFHLSEPLVAEGDTVRTGELIGRTGASGRVTGPHLHWIARHGTTTVDPVSLLSLDSLMAGQLPEPAARCEAEAVEE